MHSCLMLVCLRTPFNDELVLCKDVEIKLWAKDDFPLQSVGRVFTDVDEVGECVKEMVQYYQHYRESSIVFSKGWNTHHSAETLTRILIAKAVDGGRGNDNCDNCRR